MSKPAAPPFRRFLVTGGAGFIGTNFCHVLLEQPATERLVILDALTYAGNRANLAHCLEDRRTLFVHDDIRNLDAITRLLQQEDITCIVHFAAESHVDRSIADPMLFVANNVLGTQSLLEAARTAWQTATSPRRFHHISTDEVFGSLAPGAKPVTEKAPYEPRSPYSASKAAADHLVMAYHHTFGMPVTLSYAANNYGPFQYPEKLIPFFLINALHGRSLPIYGDGLQQRDWIHVHDHCRGILAVLAAGQVGCSYNLPGTGEQTNLAIARQITTILDRRMAADAALRQRYPACPAAAGASCATLLSHISDRPGHDRRYAIDGSLAAAELDFRAVIPFGTGLEQTIDWYLEHAGWWQDILKRHGPSRQPWLKNATDR